MLKPEARRKKRNINLSISDSSIGVDRSLNWLTISVTRLGDFWKLLATNLPTKIAQKDGWLLGYFEKDRVM